LVTRGREDAPAYDEFFPARRVQTELEWSDLVLPSSTLEQLEEIRDWLLYGRTLLLDWGMSSRLRPGYTSLFCGPPGTGKTLSACLLGRLCNSEVYKIDLSMVVSKYIGETEKNLSRVFNQAEHRGWILFFDEADALFGKRTKIEDSHDRYANQEVSFLLQRIEEFDGVVILASNLRHNIDDAFLRRFQSVVQFPMPASPERLRIWREAFPEKATLEQELDLPRIADRYELSGGTIVNVTRYAALRALARGDRIIRAADVEEGIRRELQKEGRAF
jgi:SpoVK/Ycf46/Vps4 family AAA+-type ATPase